MLKKLNKPWKKHAFGMQITLHRLFSRVWGKKEKRRIHADKPSMDITNPFFVHAVLTGTKTAVGQISRALASGEVPYQLDKFFAFWEFSRFTHGESTMFMSPRIMTRIIVKQTMRFHILHIPRTILLPSLLWESTLPEGRCESWIGTSLVTAQPSPKPAG